VRVLDPRPGVTSTDGGATDSANDVSAGAAVAGSTDPLARGLAAVMGLLGAAAAFVASRPLSDNSFLTHLATGRLILADGVPATNPFLYTGTSFPVPSWWWSILLALAEDLGGATAIRLLTAAVAFAVGAVLVRLARPSDPSQGTGLLAVVLPAALALFCVFQFLSGRPHLAGYLLVALVLVVWNEERSPWWIVGLFAIWVNVHGSWLYGVAVLVLFGVARAIDDRRLRPRDLGCVAASIGGLVLGGALYPRAFELVLLPTRQFGDPIEREALQAYREWARVPFDQPMLWALLALGAVALVGALRSRRWASAGVVVVMVLMGWSGSRLVPIAAVSLVPFAAAALRDVGSLRLPTGAMVRRCWAVTAAVLALTVVYCLVVPSYRLDRFPVEAVDWMQERDLTAGGARVMSHDYVGNYLEWRYGADAEAYVDDRPDAATLVQYRRILRLEDGWQDELAQVDPEVVLWHTDSPLSDELADDDAWVLATRQGDFSVFCRAELAERCS
jgi:hypothetical protein